MKKYKIQFTNNFKKNIKLIKKQNKNMEKLFTIIESLSFKDHPLINDKLFTNCRECHIEPDWLLVYKYEEDKLILILIATGSHSNILK